MGLDSILPPVVMEIRAKLGDTIAEIRGVGTELEEAAKRGEGATGKLSKGFNGVAAVGQKLTIGVAGIAGTVGGFAIEAATSAEVVDAKLRTAIQNAGGDFDALEPKITNTDQTMRKYGFTNDQTNTSLATLTTALKDPNKAMSAMTVAADLARSKNIDLNTASLLVAKAMEGQTRPLKALGIDLPIAAGNSLAVKKAQDALAAAQQKVTDVLAKYPDAADKASKGHAQYVAATDGVTKAQGKLTDAQSAGGKILDELQSRVKGAGDAYGKTLRGQLDSAKAGVENMAESLGKSLIPWINKAIAVATKIFNYLGDHKWILETIGVIIGVTMVAGITKWAIEFGKSMYETGAKFVTWLAQHTLWNSTVMANYVEQATAAEASAAEQVVAQETVQGATEATAAVSTEAGFATSAALGPIMIVIAAIIAIALLLKDHWKQVWGAICDAAKWAYDNVIKPVADFIMKYAIQPIIDGAKLLYSVWKLEWDLISGAVRWVYDNVIQPVAHAIGTGLDDVGKALQWFGQLWNEIWGAIGSGLSWVWNHTIGPIVNIIKDALGWISNVAGKVGGFFSKVGSFLGFADGGVVPGTPGAPMLAVVHGGEFVLSRDMLAGRQQPTGLDKVMKTSPGDPSAAAFSGVAPVGGGTGSGVVVIANTNASPSQIASSVGWELRKRAS